MNKAMVATINATADMLRTFSGAYRLTEWLYAQAFKLRMNDGCWRGQR